MVDTVLSCSIATRSSTNLRSSAGNRTITGPIHCSGVFRLRPRKELGPRIILTKRVVFHGIKLTPLARNNLARNKISPPVLLCDTYYICAYDLLASIHLRGMFGLVQQAGEQMGVDSVDLEHAADKEFPETPGVDGQWPEPGTGAFQDGQIRPLGCTRWTALMEL